MAKKQEGEEGGEQQPPAEASKEAVVTAAQVIAHLQAELDLVKGELEKARLELRESKKTVVGG